MFSGIVLEQGTVVDFERRKNLCVLSVRGNKAVHGVRVGDSVCVSGVCLTVTKVRSKILSFDMMKETLDTTALGELNKGDRVNLELSLRADGRLGGHFVTGHVDGVGTIQEVVTSENYVEFRIAPPRALRKYIAPKGSIAIDGISLTIGRVHVNDFSVYLIPLTLEVTTAGKKKRGDRVNIEVDILARYILNRRT